nr:hypothetical protein [Tanacetum cinerariifolium]
MPPRMTKQSTGRATVAPRGGRTGGRTGRGGSRPRGRSGNQGNGGIDGQGVQVGVQVGGQGSKVNDSVDGVPDFSIIIAHQLQNLLPTIVAQVGNQGSNQGNGLIIMLRSCVSAYDKIMPPRMTKQSTGRATVAPRGGRTGGRTGRGGSRPR